MTEIICGDPGLVPHASTNDTLCHYNDTVTYTCDEGYGLRSGDLKRTCTDTGEWSGSRPVCGRFQAQAWAVVDSLSVSRLKACLIGIGYVPCMFVWDYRD